MGELKVYFINLGHFIIGIYFTKNKKMGDTLAQYRWLIGGFYSRTQRIKPCVGNMLNMLVYMDKLTNISYLQSVRL